VKDLRIFKGIDLKDVLIIDNYVYSFAFHLENGIPIVPFFGEKDDQEMIKVIKYIRSIHDQDDLRVPNDKIF
jgi:CTD small phosphatase-like protein 2